MTRTTARRFTWGVAVGLILGLAATAAAQWGSGGWGGFLPLHGGTLFGPLRLPDGSASAPSVGSVNSVTGLAFPSTNVAIMAVNSIERMRWAATGTIIGMSSGISFGWSSSAIAGTPLDTILLRDAANTLAQRNGTSPQTFRVYNTWTSATDNELGRFGWVSNVLHVGTVKGSGGGTARALALVTDATERWHVGATTGHLTAGLDNTYDIGQSGATRPRNVYAAGNYYGNGSTLSGITGATGGVANAGSTTIGSDTDSSGGESIFFQTQVTTRWLVDGTNGPGHFVPQLDATYDLGRSTLRPRDVYVGRQLLAADGSASAPSHSFSSAASTGVWRTAGGAMVFTLGGTNHAVLINSGWRLSSGGQFGFSSLADPTSGASDTILLRDAANMLALANGGTAASPVPQQLNVYNFRVSTSDYERLETFWSSNTAIIRTANAGTGTARNLRVYYGNTTGIAVSIGAATNNGVQLASNGSSGAIETGRVIVGSVTNTATSGNSRGLVVANDYNPTATSTMVALPFEIKPVINYSNATPGAGSYEALRLAITEAALPTGQSYLLRASVGATANSDAFSIFRDGQMNIYNPGITNDPTGNYERLEARWAANTAIVGIAVGGTGTARSLQLRYGGTATTAITLGTAANGGLSLGTYAATGAQTSGRVIVGGSNTGTSGTGIGLTINDSYAPTAESTLVGVPLRIAPTINYSAGTPGAGSYEALKIAVTEIALPTGQSYLIRASAGAGGATDIFGITNTGRMVLAKKTAAGVAPGAGLANFEVVCGTNAGTAKLIMVAGTSSTPVTVVDNVGAGVTGC